MRNVAGSFICLLLLVRPGWADQPQAKIVEENWNAAQLNGRSVGYSHMIVRELAREGKKIYVSTVELKLNLRREGQAIQIGMETGSEETADGQVSRVWMRQFQGTRTTVNLQGIVKQDELEVTVKDQNQNQQEFKVPWDERAIGFYRQEKIFRERKVKPGDKFSFVTFEPTVNGLLTNRVTVKDHEEVQTLKGKKERLLRVEELPDKVEGPQGMMQLPGMTTWLDKDLRPICSEFEMPLLGKMRLCRGDKSVVTAPGAAGMAPEILVFIPLGRPIARPNETRSAVYRITLKGDTDPGTAFVNCDRQKSTNVKGDTFELRVQAIPEPKLAANPGKVKDEYLKSCFYINSDDSRVRKLARQAVGDETDPWAKARLIERWVHDHMNVSFTRDFCSAGEVAKQLSGDCRQHSMLAAAMCRAVDVPSRTAIGLVYATDRSGRIGMAFHMWTEVWIDGQWLAIDPTRGEGHVGATHLKVTDSSWHDETSLKPLLPVLRIAEKGKLSIKVIHVDYAD